MYDPKKPKTEIALLPKMRFMMFGSRVKFPPSQNIINQTHSAYVYQFLSMKIIVKFNTI
jgi:hypothetical protein